MSSNLHAPHGENLRTGRVSIPGQVYLITTVTADRAPIFADLFNARCLITVLREHQQRARAHTLSYVLMPDHLHWLMQLDDSAVLSEVVRSVKAISSLRLGRPLWQKGFHDRALRRDEDMAAVARYIVANPLRAGLVENLGDYAHWDAVWL